MLQVVKFFKYDNILQYTNVWKYIAISCIEWFLHVRSNTDEFHRMTLLLGPPSSGKTTLLLALAGKLGSDLQVSQKSRI